MHFIKALRANVDDSALNKGSFLKRDTGKNVPALNEVLMRGMN